MTDPGDDGTGIPPAADDSAVSGLTIGDIKGLISSMLNKETPARSAGRGAVNSRLDRDSEIAETVERELRKMHEQEERTRKEKERDTLLEDLKKKTEHSPIERRKIHKIMGWGEPSEK